jgi:hypothetical protein
MRRRWLALLPAFAGCAELLGADFDDTGVAQPNDASTLNDSPTEAPGDSPSDAPSESDGPSFSCAHVGTPPSITTGKPASSAVSFSDTVRWDEFVLPPLTAS